MSTARATVIVAARNAEDDLPGLLDALEAQTAARESFEVIVVDDGSSDSTGQLAAARDWVRTLRTEGVGAPAARNRAVEESSGELLAFTDADCRPRADWIERGLAHFEAEPGLDILGGAIEVGLPPNPTTAGLVDAARFLDQERMVAMGFAVTANMWIRRETFLSVGGFNPALSPNAQEDAELGKLLTSRGATIAFGPDVMVVHPARDSILALGRKGYRLGRQHATLRRHSRHRGPWLRPYFARRRVFVPVGTVKRISRLHERGIHPSRARRAGMLATEITFVSAAHVAGDIAGTIASHLPGRRR